jgi:fluoride ion exporter CrcB/FEX
MGANNILSPRQFTIALLAVASGGAVGTLLRDLLLRGQHASIPRGIAIYTSDSANGSWTGQIPWVLLAINFVGVYAATKLLRGALRQRDPNDPTRLLVITGFFGGFTSYSGLFVAFAAIWHLSIGGSIFVAAGAVGSGIFAGWLGLGRRHP